MGTVGVQSALVSQFLFAFAYFIFPVTGFNVFAVAAAMVVICGFYTVLVSISNYIPSHLSNITLIVGYGEIGDCESLALRLFNCKLNSRRVPTSIVQALF